MEFLGAAAIAATLSLGWVLRPVIFGRQTWKEFSFSYLYPIYLSPVGSFITWLSEKDKEHSIVQAYNYKHVRIVPIAVLGDNYAYLIIDTREGTAVVVDPADPKQVLKALEKEKVRLTAILTTHRHWDHSGGNSRLTEAIKYVDVYGSLLDNVPCLTKPLNDNEKFQIGNLQFQAILSPSHTQGHLLYLLDMSGSGEPSSLFTGDSLFVAGAGQFFEGNAYHLRILVERLQEIPADTLFWPGHEYALTNLMFAVGFDSDNPALLAKITQTKNTRGKLGAVIPSTIKDEFEYNLFLRASVGSIARHFLTSSNIGFDRDDVTDPETHERVLTAMRKQKNDFVYP